MRGRTLADRLGKSVGWPGKASRAVMSCRPVQASYGTAGFRQPRRTRSRAAPDTLGWAGASRRVSGGCLRFKVVAVPNRETGSHFRWNRSASLSRPSGRPPEPSLRCRSCGISRSPRAFAARGLRSGRSFTRPVRHTGQARGITPRRHDVRRLQTAPFPHGEVTGVWGGGGWVWIKMNLTP